MMVIEDGWLWLMMTDHDDDGDDDDDEYDEGRWLEKHVSEGRWLEKISFRKVVDWRKSAFWRSLTRENQVSEGFVE